MHICVDLVVEHLLKLVPGLRHTSFTIAGSAALALFLGFEGTGHKNLRVFFDDVDVFYAGLLAGVGYQQDRKVRCEALGIVFNLVEFAYGSKPGAILASFDINAVQVGLEVSPGGVFPSSYPRRRCWWVSVPFLEFLQEPSLKLLSSQARMAAVIRLLIKSKELQVAIAPMSDHVLATILQLNGEALTALQQHKVAVRIPELQLSTLKVCDRLFVQVQDQTLQVIVGTDPIENVTLLPLSDTRFSVFQRRKERFDEQRPAVRSDTVRDDSSPRDGGPYTEVL